MTHPAYLLAAWLFLVGLYGVMTSRHLIHLVLCVSITQSSTLVLLLAGPRLDGVGRMLLLLDIAGQAALTGLLLALAVVAHERSGELDPRRARALRE